MRRPLETPQDEDPNPQKRRRVGETNEGDTEADSDSYESEVADLQIELDKERPKKKTIKRLMKSTFLGRRHWITKDQPVVREVLEVFPCLSQSKYVSEIW